VFFRDSFGQVYLIYATFSRGGEEFLTAYRILDIMPKGRDENGPYDSLGDWVCPHPVWPRRHSRTEREISCRGLCLCGS